MDKFGDIVRSKREAKGLLLRQLAAMIDVDAAILSKIERGERKARREQVIRIADALEFNVNELIIQYLSENIAYEILQEDSANDILKVAESKINYLRNIK